MHFDAAGAKEDLAAHKLPAYFLDFETIWCVVPVWPGTRPYQQIPFQFSVHRLARTGRLEHCSHLDLSGDDPSEGFARALIEACGERGPIFAYNASFERTRIGELADRFPRLAARLHAINARVFDLLEVTRARYYHPSQQGNWGLKAVLPAIAPDLGYDQLGEVQNGALAMEAFREAVHPDTAPERKATLGRDLEDYCKLDTLALVRVWAFCSGREDLT